jgi:hypothetical protein
MSKQKERPKIAVDSPLGAVIALIAVVALIFAVLAWNNSRDSSAAAPQAVTSVSTNASAGTTNNSAVDNSSSTTTSDARTFVNGAGPCDLDKVGTWSEGNGPFRIEVGGHMVQHFDFYPAPDVPAVSFIVPPIADPSGVPDLAFGYGSMWEGPSCNYVADATHYARARLDSNHSGLVVVWGTWQVLANVNDYDDVAGLLATDKAAFEMK